MLDFGKKVVEGQEYEKCTSHQSTFTASEQDLRVWENFVRFVLPSCNPKTTSWTKRGKKIRVGRRISHYSNRFVYGVVFFVST